MPSRTPNRTIVGLLVVIAMDALVTGPFVFRGAVEGDTLRYALGLYRWIQGDVGIVSLFNAEMSFGYYQGLAAGWQVQSTALADIPDLLNRLSWIFGVLGAGACYLWWERWWNARVALRLALLFIVTPAFWSLHLYGNTNIVGLALAAGAIAALPGSGSHRFVVGRTILAAVLGVAALSVRTDLLLLVPAFLGFLLWGRDRPGWRRTGAVALVCLGGYFLLRWAMVGGDGGGSTLLRHWKGNLNLVDARWLFGTVMQNVVFLASAGPPLVFLASAGAFLAVKRPAVRMSSLLWIAPMLVFLLFGRVHLTRILLPLLPGLLLPLAVWATEGRRRRDVLLFGTVLGAHLAMTAVPPLFEHFSARSSQERRVSHYFFRGPMIRDHWTIQREADDIHADARQLLAEIGRDPSAVVVIGEDVLFYEFALASAYPGTRAARIGHRYQLELRQLDVPGRAAPIYLLLPRWGKDPEEALREFAIPPEVRRRYTMVEARRRGLLPSVSEAR